MNFLKIPFKEVLNTISIKRRFSSKKNTYLRVITQMDRALSLKKVKVSKITYMDILVKKQGDRLDLGCYGSFYDALWLPSFLEYPLDYTHPPPGNFSLPSL